MMDSLTHSLSNLQLNEEHIRVDFGEYHFIIRNNTNFFSYLSLVCDSTHEFGNVRIKITLVKNGIECDTIYTNKNILKFLYQMK